MDEKTRELLEQGFAERAQLAFTAMREADPVADALVKDTAELSIQVERSDGITEEAKVLVQQYLSATGEVDSAFQKYLYIQGARDCVELLRALGVIR